MIPIGRSHRRASPTPRPKRESDQSRLQLQRSWDTAPEKRLRSALHRCGLRYRVHARPLPDLRREADIVFRRARVAVFVDGCFWHSCPQHGAVPRNNATWWRRKFDATRRRDRDTDRKLRAAGWTAVRIWEHEAVEEGVRRVVLALSPETSA